MILDPDGMFNGDRVARLSLEARLYLPWYMLAANDFGRLELNYQRLRNRIFSRFPAEPSEQAVWGHFGEYAEQHLGFVYQALGQVWCQFDTSEKFLPRYKSKSSQASPNPGPAFLEWKSEYSKLKQQSLQIKPIPLTVFKNSAENLPQSFGKVSHGIGIGVGVGVGIGIGSSMRAQESAATALAPDALPLTLAAARKHFPSVNGKFLTKLSQKVISAGVEGVTDARLAEAVAETFQPNYQRTPSLWLETVPEYLLRGGAEPADFDPLERNREVLAEEERAQREWLERVAEVTRGQA